MKTLDERLDPFLFKFSGMPNFLMKEDVKAIMKVFARDILTEASEQAEVIYSHPSSEDHGEPIVSKQSILKLIDEVK